MITRLLEVIGDPMTALKLQWAEALRDIILRHPDRRSTPVLQLIGDQPPMLYVGLDRGYDTVDLEKSRAPFAISTVKLTYFPGRELAQKWLAAAWAGYLIHEALELTTVGDLITRPLDPHTEPYITNPYNRSLREGFPVQLTPNSLRATLTLVMSEAAADSLIAGKS